jgi:ribosomal protein S2
MPQIINLTNLTANTGKKIISIKNDEVKQSTSYVDTYEENLNILISKYPGVTLFDLRTIAHELSASYEFIRRSAEKGKILFKQNGKKKVVHRGEVARLITEGVN